MKIKVLLFVVIFYFFAPFAEGKQLVFRDGSVLEAKSYFRMRNKVIVRTGYAELTFDVREVDLKKSKLLKLAKTKMVAKEKKGKRIIYIGPNTPDTSRVVLEIGEGYDGTGVYHPEVIRFTESNLQQRTQGFLVRNVNSARVYVPVTLQYGSRNVVANLQMDTGADRTMISPSVAHRLGIDLMRMPLSSDTYHVADGSIVSAWDIWVDRISAGPRTQIGFKVLVMPSGNSDGLLGMDFLRDAKLDLKNGVIVWGP